MGLKAQARVTKPETKAPPRPAPEAPPTQDKLIRIAAVYARCGQTNPTAFAQEVGRILR